MAEIICVRHGQASFGTDNYDQLSELGYRQARLLGEYLLKSGVRFDHIYAGTLKRQVQTAQSVIDVYRENAEIVPELICDARWNELQTDEQVKALVPHIIAANPELDDSVANARHDKKALQKLIRATFDFWINNPQVTGDGAHQLEPWVSEQDRVIAALGDVRARNQRGQCAGVFTSGGILAILAAHVQNMPASSVYPLFEKVINCSLTRLMHNQSQVALSTFNEYSYLSAMAETGQESALITYR